MNSEKALLLFKTRQSSALPYQHPDDTGGQRVAVRNGALLTYLLNDYLGFISVILKTKGREWDELSYSAWNCYGNTTASNIYCCRNPIADTHCYSATRRDFC
jgi:hypothetical protein